MAFPHPQTERKLIMWIRDDYCTVKTLYLEGFQSIEEYTKIDFSNLTLLFGPNSAGKSSVYDALDLAQKLFNHPEFELGSNREDWDPQE